EDAGRVLAPAGVYPHHRARGQHGLPVRIHARILPQRGHEQLQRPQKLLQPLQLHGRTS
ncbi:hypothetical protein M9458_043299, partial [Cirrhinus mrigala]